MLLVFTLLAGPILAQPPVTVELAHVARIDFPTAPQVQDTLGQRIYSATVDSTTFLLMSRQLDTQPGFQLAPDDLPGFYLGLAKGATQASGGKVLRQRSFAVDGLQGLELTYTNQANPALPAEITSRTVYVNGYLFTYQVLASAEAAPGIQ